MRTTAIAATIALISFLLGNVWVFASAGMFVQYFYAASMVAVTHTFTLGWVSLMIVGVLRQLGPIAFGLKLRATPLVGIAVVLWVPALIAMIIGFHTSRYVLAAIGTSVLLLSILSIVSVFVYSFRGVRREPPHQHLLASLLYFAAAAIIGAWMGLSKGVDLPLPAAFHRVLFAHIHLAGAGWAGMMILAVMSRLFPQPHLREPIHARIRFIAFNTGLIGLTIGLLFDQAWYPFCGGILASAVIWYSVAFIPVLHEFEQPSDRSTEFLVTAWLCLALVGGIGLWLCTGIGGTTTFRMQLQFAYGFIYMFGWLSLMIFGMLYRILPTHISKFLASRGIHSLTGIRTVFINPHFQNITWVLLVIGLFISVLAILSQNVSMFRLGWGIWLAGITVFVVGLFRLAAVLRSMVRMHRTA